MHVSTAAAPVVVTVRPVCAHAPDWQVGPKLRACTSCLPTVLAHFYERWDGFVSAVVTPLRAPGGAA